MFDHIHVGDTVLIDNRADNIALVAGRYEATVVDEDASSLAVDLGCGKWWFYRDDGHSYTGEAVIRQFV